MSLPCWNEVGGVVQEAGSKKIQNYLIKLPNNVGGSILGSFFFLWGVHNVSSTLYADNVTLEA